MCSPLQLILVSCIVFGHSRSVPTAEAYTAAVKETVYDINLYITIPASFAVLAFVALILYCLMCATCRDPDPVIIPATQPVFVSTRSSPVMVSAQHCSRSESHEKQESAPNGGDNEVESINDRQNTEKSVQKSEVSDQSRNQSADLTDKVVTLEKEETPREESDEEDVKDQPSEVTRRPGDAFQPSPRVTRSQAKVANAAQPKDTNKTNSPKGALPSKPKSRDRPPVSPKSPSIKSKTKA